ncbi:MAG TPA: type II toxin-antitoxin system YafQ family toxin [Candidatus Acidoferrales bacterium]|nr:type II toxin-antitoxin system YafQ family toxin [Candidatus Acidoferrales bacterium]
MRPAAARPGFVGQDGILRRIGNPPDVVLSGNAATRAGSLPHRPSGLTLVRKRGKDMAKLRESAPAAARGKPVAARCKDHPLAGDWNHHRDCHLEPDWLLICKIDGDDLHLVRTGTHSDLF